MDRRAVGLVLLVALGAFCTRRLPHGGDNPIYPFKGKHQGVACEACHGPRDAPDQGCSGWPKKQSTSCRDCHIDDLPSMNHYPNQECFPCHDESSWLVDVPPDTGPPTSTGSTGETADDTGFDHDQVSELTKCWNCHEDERPDTDPDHWSDRPFDGNRWDCSPCHTVDSWTDDDLFYPEHAVRVPHGTSDNQEGVLGEDFWVITCDPCHKSGPPYDRDIQCTESCHLDDVFNEAGNPPQHNGETHDSDPMGRDDGTGCMSCHWYGDYWRPGTEQ